MNRLLATLMAAALCAAPVLGAEPGSVAGQLLGVDSRPAAGYQVVLVGPDGEAAGAGSTDAGGEFRIDPVDPGEYGIGIINPDGEAAPVLAAPTEVRSGEQVVRDIRLLETAGGTVQLAPAKGGVGVWWAGLSPGAKVWTVMGTLTGIGLIYGATKNDNAAAETPVTPFRIDQ